MESVALQFNLVYSIQISRKDTHLRPKTNEESFSGKQRIAYFFVEMLYLTKNDGMIPN